LSYDLVRLVTKNRAGSGIPAGHNAFAIYSYDGMIDHAVENKPEAFFRILQKYFALLSRTYVLRGADESCRAARRIEHHERLRAPVCRVVADASKLNGKMLLTVL
jgi:hypothetical protein